MSNLRVGRPGRSALSRALPSCLVPRREKNPTSCIVLDYGVPVQVLPDGLEQEWAMVCCGRRTAYGCGVHGQKILDGLTIYVRLVKPADVTSALYIDASDLACGAVLAEFDESTGPDLTIDREDLSAEGFVKTVGEDLMVLAVAFYIRRLDSLVYYLIYDALDRSLAMIPCPPGQTTCALTPLTVRHNAGDYELVFVSKEMVAPLGGNYQRTSMDILYGWTPVCEWRAHEMRYPEAVGQYFFVDAMFTFGGRAFFIDLAKGLVHCYLPAVDKDPVVDFEFIPLHAEVQCDRPLTMDLNMDRTMRCVQGSIRLVCIDRSAGQGPEVKVTVWTLDLPSKQWTKDKEVLAGALWKLPSFKNLGLPRTAPKFPVLMPNGTLSLLLPNLCKKKEDSMDDYICNLDDHSLRFYWSARLNGYTYGGPLILPPGFFSMVIRPSDSMPRTDIFM